MERLFVFDRYVAEALKLLWSQLIRVQMGQLFSAVAASTRRIIYGHGTDCKDLCPGFRRSFERGGGHSGTLAQASELSLAVPVVQVRGPLKHVVGVACPDP
jgi:hypothetical protein